MWRHCVPNTYLSFITHTYLIHSDYFIFNDNKNKFN